MGRLKPRQERFCQLFVECANASTAARDAGYSVEFAQNAGYRLLRHPLIAARIAAIQAEIGRTACRNAEVLLGKLETVYRRSVADRHFSTAARAVELQARISGMVRHPERAGDRVDWDQFDPAHSDDGGQGRAARSGAVTAHRPPPRPVNDN